MRIGRIEVQDENLGEDIQEGKFFLIRIVYNDRGGREMYHLCAQPGRTNQSHEQRLNGWLGETNNVSRYAEGAVEVYANARGELRVRRTDAQALLDAVNPSVEIEPEDEVLA